MKTTSIFAVTTIHDRHGRRVGSYLVDLTKDSLEREKSQDQPQRESDSEEQAVVFHHDDEGSVGENKSATRSNNNQPATAIDLTV